MGPPALGLDGSGWNGTVDVFGVCALFASPRSVLEEGWGWGMR